MAKNIVLIALALTLILSGVSVWFAYTLFMQREELKGRTQKLETTIHQVAANTELGENSDKRVTIPPDQLKTFKVKPDGPQQDMNQPLSLLVAATASQMQSLITTRAILEETKRILAETQEKLAKTEAELAETQAKVRELNATVAERDNTIVAKESAIKVLEADIAGKDIDLAEQKRTIEDRDVEIEVLNTANTDKETRIAELEEKLRPKRPEEKVKPGKQGELVFVSSDWNFVIFALPEDLSGEVSQDLVLMVHRKDQLVGKIKVTTVLQDKKLVIAEILNDYQKMPFEKGDGVLY